MTNEYLAPVIAITNHKGGVAKTTSVINLSAEFGRKGCSVLVIDLDPQGNASNHIGSIDFSKISNNAARLMCDPATKNDIAEIVSCVHTTVNPGFDNVHYVPSQMNLDKLVMETIKMSSSRPDEELKRRLDKIRAVFDIVLIDCPPSLTTLTNNAISAATHYIIPVDTGTDYSTSGLIGLMKHISDVSTETNENLEFLGVLLTRHDESKNANKAIAASVELLEKELSGAGRMLPVYIRSSVKVAEASLAKTSIRKIARSNNVTIDYNNLADHLLDRLSIRKSMLDD